jgi:hypothetical protein
MDQKVVVYVVWCRYLVFLTSVFNLAHASSQPSHPLHSVHVYSVPFHQRCFNLGIHEGTTSSIFSSIAFPSLSLSP